MTIKEKKEACLKYFNLLADALKDTHEVVESCNQDSALYLIPKGTKDQLTYHSKPADSYRYSDHWNWYANVNKCKDPHYIQCYNVDLPWARKRLENGKASKPISATCIAYFSGDDNKYHHVYGEKFNRKTRAWSFERKRVFNVAFNKNKKHVTQTTIFDMSCPWDEVR